MRVMCLSMDDFLKNLEATPKRPSLRLYDSAIYLQQVDKPSLNNQNQPSDVVFEVIVRLSAVVITQDGQHLLEADEFCGKDYRDSTQELSGSKKAESVRAKVLDFCREQDWIIRPGIVGI